MNGRPLGREDGLSVSAGEWFALAEEALAALEGVPQKRRGAVLEELHRRFGPHPTHIRRAAKAGGFLRELGSSEPVLAKALQTQSYQAVEILERWYQVDQRGARRAARRLLDGGYSIAALADDQKKRTVLDIDLDDAFEEQLASSFARLASKAAHQAISGSIRQLKKRPPGLGLGSVVDQLVIDEHGTSYAIFLTRKALSDAELSIHNSVLAGDVLKCIALKVRPVVAYQKDRNILPFQEMLRSFDLAETSVEFVPVDFSPRLAALTITD